MMTPQASQTGPTRDCAKRLEQFFGRLYEEAADGLPDFEVRIAGRPTLRFGKEEPAFAIAVHNDAGLSAILSGDENHIAEAYMGGALDLDGDMLALYALRNSLRDRHPLLHLWRVRLQPWLFGQVARDKKWITQHYDYDQGFYLLFLDQRFRAYSQGIFADQNEPLEEAMERKLEFALHSLRIKTGARVLDIGGGWGAFTQYAGQRDIQVTSLTISQQSEHFLQRLIAENQLPCRVLREHFYEHQSAEPYDAIVNLGVTEHLPDYRRSLARYHELLKPGGRIYLDASACREKHDFSSFISRYIYPGNPTPMCLANYLSELERSPFEIIELHNDRKSYEWTAQRWAENLDRSREEIVKRWGEAHYRKFRLYLWGTAHAFATNLMSAYRLVLENPAQVRNLARWRH
jgi:cyclopropane-fatty-acyl-phospholipid synthase